MQNFNLRSRAALIVLVAVLLVGLGSWTFSRNGSSPEMLMPLTPPPPGSLEIPAGGDDEKDSPGANTKAGAADAIPSGSEKPASQKRRSLHRRRARCRSCVRRGQPARCLYA